LRPRRRTRRSTPWSIGKWL